MDLPTNIYQGIWENKSFSQGGVNVAELLAFVAEEKILFDSTKPRRDELVILLQKLYPQNKTNSRDGSLAVDDVPIKKTTKKKETKGGGGGDKVKKDVVDDVADFEIPEEKKQPKTRLQGHLNEFAKKGGWSTVLFSAVLFGHPTNPEESKGYMVKALQNMELIRQQYPGSQVALYYDETVAADLIHKIKELKLDVILIYVKHHLGKGIMLARLLELTKKRAGVKWVFTVDIHDEFSQQENYRLGINRVVDYVIVPDIPRYDLQIMFFPYKEAKCVEFKGRVPHYHVDAAGIGLSTSSKMPAIETFISGFFKQYNYTYGDDEFVLDNWISSRHPHWYDMQASGVLYLPADEEHDMDTGNALIVDPTPVGAKAASLANEILDWTMFPATGLALHAHCGKVYAQTSLYGALGSKKTKAPKKAIEAQRTHKFKEIIQEEGHGRCR